MFRSINLCGAEINTKFSEQHRTHLLHSSIKIYCNQFALCCQHKRIPVRTLEQPICSMMENISTHILWVMALKETYELGSSPWLQSNELDRKTFKLIHPVLQMLHISVKLTNSKKLTSRINKIFPISKKNIQKNSKIKKKPPAGALFSGAQNNFPPTVLLICIILRRD